MRKRQACILVNVLVLSLIIKTNLTGQTGPQPGDIYKEYSVNLKVGNNWRVTDPDVTREDAQAFLPNPVLSINIDDLEGAIRAEAMMDIWGGHTGTTGKKFRFNNNEWIDIPKLTTTPEGNYSECYLSQYNTIVNLPLEYLIEGENNFEGTSGTQLCNSFNWGQWGWYVMIVRIYYDEDKIHTRANISDLTNGSEFNENPVLEITSENSDDISEVQYIARYNGYDENGDGIYNDWHWAYHSPELVDHIGTSKSPPFNVTWKTEWIPDQEEGAIAIIARIKDKNDIWFVTDSVFNLSLKREAGKSVKMFTSRDLPIGYSVRNNKKKDCFSDISTLENAVTAKLFHRTWNAADDHAASGSLSHPLFVNENIFKCYGKNHFYALSSADIPIAELKTGQNTISYKSTTLEHGIEVLWPGPAIIIKYDENAEKVNPPVFETDSGTGFSEPFFAKISSSTPGAIMTYSTDRYDPHMGRTLYPSSGVYITGTTTLKARAFKEGMIESDLVEAVYNLTTGFYSFEDTPVKLYPNPTNDFIVIDSDLTPTRIILFDIQGKKILERVDSSVLDLNGVSEGWYILELVLGNRGYSFNIIKN